MIRAVQVAATYAPLVLVLACLAVEWKRTVSPEAWLIVAGFFVSFIADTVGYSLAAMGRNTWWLTYVYVPLQFGIWITALTRSRAVRWVGVLGLLAIAGSSLLRGPLTVPETVVQVGAGLGVAWLAWGIPAPYRPALLLYCLGAVPFLVGMAVLPMQHPGWLWVWVGYQSVRLLAVGFMVRALLPRPHLEVVDGRGHASSGRGERRLARRPRRDPAHAA